MNKKITAIIIGIMLAVIVIQMLALRTAWGNERLLAEEVNANYKHQTTK